MRRALLKIASAALALAALPACDDGGNIHADYSASYTTEGEDMDDDGFASDLDCDETDPSVNPAADEICDDEIDNDCDDLVDMDDDDCQ